MKTETPLFFTLRKPHRRLTTQGIRKRFMFYFRKAGWRENLGPHSLRHAIGTFLMSRGVPITTVSKKLRHQDLTTTLTYMNHVPSMHEPKHQNLHELVPFTFKKKR
jgi:integrase/recombinase XerD